MVNLPNYRVVFRCLIVTPKTRTKVLFKFGDIFQKNGEPSKESCNRVETQVKKKNR